MIRFRIAATVLAAALATSLFALDAVAHVLSGPDRHFLELHFIVFLWGFTAILGKLITVPAVELVLYRTLVATAALAAIPRSGRNSAMCRHFAADAGLLDRPWPGFLYAARSRLRHLPP